MHPIPIDRIVFVRLFSILCLLLSALLPATLQADTASVKPTSKADLILKAPPKYQRKGAIRGVRISFVVYANRSDADFALVSPPKGMRIKRTIRGESFLTPPLLWGASGAWIVWDVPMDAKEGKVYSVTVKASDPTGRSKTVTFPIKVPKTYPIQTALKHNELIVTDKDSPLYGMKLKGHNGEDVSKVRLRSVRYEDAPSHSAQPLDATKPIDHIVFVVDNLPEKIDIKFPEWMDEFEKERLPKDVRIFQYLYYDMLTSGNPWDWRYGGDYLYEGTDGVVLPKMFGSGKFAYGGSKLIMITINEK